MSTNFLSLKTRYLDVPYEMREEAKKYRCRFLPDQKQWTCRITDDHDNDDMFSFLNKYQLVYLNVPYDDKDIVKSKGAKWHASTKTWFTYAGNAELKSYM
jgi:hypothetical protein